MNKRVTKKTEEIRDERDPWDEREENEVSDNR
jgi:hypothetical protein